MLPWHMIIRLINYLFLRKFIVCEFNFSLLPFYCVVFLMIGGPDRIKKKRFFYKKIILK